MQRRWILIVQLQVLQALHRKLQLSPQGQVFGGRLLFPGGILLLLIQLGGIGWERNVPCAGRNTCESGAHWAGVYEQWAAIKQNGCIPSFSSPVTNKYWVCVSQPRIMLSISRQVRHFSLPLSRKTTALFLRNAYSRTRRPLNINFHIESRLGSHDEVKIGGSLILSFELMLMTRYDFKQPGLWLISNIWSTVYALWSERSGCMDTFGSPFVSNNQ